MSTNTPNELDTLIYSNILCNISAPPNVIARIDIFGPNNRGVSEILYKAELKTPESGIKLVKQLLRPEFMGDEGPYTLFYSRVDKTGRWPRYSLETATSLAKLPIHVESIFNNL